MNISLTKAVDNIKTYYNKPEMFQYFFIAAVFPIITLAVCGYIGFSIFSAANSGNKDAFPMLILSFIGIYIIFLIISVIFSILMNGMYITAMHNAICAKNKIFPSISSDFGPILKTGAIFTGCSILASIACSIINQMLSGTTGPLMSAAESGNSASINLLIVVMILYTAVALLQMLFMWLMMISFSRKLKFEQYFDLGWCWKFLTKKVKELTMLGVYNILLFIPIIIAIIALFAYSFPLVKNAGDANMNESFVALFTVFAVVMFFVYIYYLFIQVVNIDLISQIIGKRNKITVENKI